MTFYSNPKVKQYGVLNPRGKALYEDSDRFGTKMLEKMGWSKGKGLGANLDGSLNFIKATHKDNQKGMGFKDRDDQWTQHEDNFNALLKSFESGGDESQVKQDAEDSSGESSGRIGFGFKSESDKPKPTKESVFSGVSLEEQSKKSKSRVHYKKFTRGKDMARYSEQDLANIFGKRSLGDKHAYAAEAEVETISKEQEIETPGTEEKTFGVTVIKTGLSVTDYFKAKMDAMRANRKGPDGAKSSNPFYVYQPEKVTLSFPKEEETESDISSDKALNKKRKHETIEQEEGTGDNSEEPIKKVKKSKNKSKQLLIEDVQLVESSPDPNSEQVVPPIKKSKKKSKLLEDLVPLVESTDEIAIEQTASVLDVTEKKKSKKKSKRTDKDVIVENIEVTEDIVQNPVVQEKKKRKQQKASDDEEGHTTNIEIAPKKSKKSKKNKRIDDVENEAILIAEDDSPEASTSEIKKPKKSREVIKTQPLHFPKFVSNILTSLYDPKIAEVKHTELEPTQTSSQPPPAIPSSTINPVPSSSHSPSTNILEETFELAKYKAEVFRFFDMDGYSGSTLSDIVGYGYSRNLQLKVVTHRSDDHRITNFWDLALVNKYGADAITIKKVTKKKRYDIKALEKKNVFKF